MQRTILLLHAYCAESVFERLHDFAARLPAELLEVVFPHLAAAAEEINLVIQAIRQKAEDAK